MFQSVDVKIPLTVLLALLKAFCLLLKVVQSVDVRNPFALPLAWFIVIVLLVFTKGVVKVKVACLLLNVVQSVEVK